MHPCGSEKGKAMAIAVQATKLDKDSLWIEVLDTDGGRTKYRKGKKVRAGSELDLAVDFFRFDEIRLVPKADGSPHLRQNESGLPKRIVVAFGNWPKSTPGAAGGWTPVDRFEYDKEAQSVNHGNK
jgi:hypothetical protein